MLQCDFHTLTFYNPASAFTSSLCSLRISQKGKIKAFLSCSWACIHVHISTCSSRSQKMSERFRTCYGHRIPWFSFSFCPSVSLPQVASLHQATKTSHNWHYFFFFFFDTHFVYGSFFTEWAESDLIMTNSVNEAFRSFQVK